MKPRPSAVHLLQRASLLLADSVEKVCDITGRQRGNAGKWVDVAYWPILLKKSVDVADPIFSASWRRFPN